MMKKLSKLWKWNSKPKTKVYNIGVPRLNKIPSSIDVYNTFYEGPLSRFSPKARLPDRPFENDETGYSVFGKRRRNKNKRNKRRSNKRSNKRSNRKHKRSNKRK